MSPSVVERLFARDRLLAVAGLVAVAALSWGYLLAGAGMENHEMDGMAMPVMRMQWSAGYFGLMALMWAVMMAAMMVPSAAPMVLFHARIYRSRATSGGAAATAMFLLGYLAIWSFFSVGAALLQWWLASAAVLSPMMQTTSSTLAASLFIAAGAYQWTPLKQSCLRRCRSPLDFVMVYWRDGAGGSLVMGLRHGAFCLGCCWLLMLLLFAGGLMNLAWVGGLALFVLVEKLAPAGHWIGRVAGAALIVWGAFTLAAA